MEKYVESFILKAGSVDIESPDLTKKDRLIYAKEQMLSTFKKVFPYVLIGVGIGAIIHNWIPEEWVSAVLGSSNPFGVVLATLVGVPMYADIFGTIPIAEALLSKGAQLGTILSFMNDTDGTVADLMTDGCNMGVKSLNKYLNQYGAADNAAKSICKELIFAEDHLRMRNQTIKVIMQTLHKTNPREKVHSEKVSELSRKIGEAMKLDNEVLKELETAGLMHGGKD